MLASLVEILCTLCSVQGVIVASPFCWWQWCKDAGEFGRHPICFFTTKMLFRYYSRLAGTNNSRLLKMAFRHSARLAHQGVKCA